MPLTGVWINKFKSVVALKEDSDGHLTGKYRSMVGRDPHVRHLDGRASPVDGEKQMLGFAVCFEVAYDPITGYGRYSLCTWSGWARDNKIIARWLLSRSVDKIEDEWSSTLVGEDRFERVSDVYQEKSVSGDQRALEELLANARHGGRK